jgi:Cu-Zn family superoxide dismutase
MTKPSIIVAIALSLPVAALSACSPDQQQSSEPGTTPPAASDAPSPTSQQPGAHALTAQLKTADGRPVATATFDFADGYATVTVQTTGAGILKPGLHHQHIHAIGKCEPDSVAPAGGPHGDFLSAGPHYQAPGHSGQPASGDLPALQVRQDGAALLVTTTDAVTKDELLSGDKTAVVLHGADYTDNAETRVACGVIDAG